MAGANQLVHWFLGGKGLGIQYKMSVWVGLPKLAKREVGGRHTIGRSGISNTGGRPWGL
jgi:hypothetical protein